GRPRQQGTSGDHRRRHQGGGRRGDLRDSSIRDQWLLRERGAAAGQVQEGRESSARREVRGAMNQTCFIRRTGRGRPVVFLGGCPTPWDVLVPIARAVASTHEAIELALPGYGESPALAHPHTAADVHAAIEASL